MPAPTLDGTNTATASTTTTVAAALTTTGTNRIACVLVYIEHAATGHWVTGVAGGGLTWAKRTQATALPGARNGQTLELWWAVAPTTLSAATITVTCNSAFDDAALLVFGVAGCNTANPWDANVSLAARSIPAASASTIAPFTGISTTQANDFLIFGWGMANSQAIGTPPAGFSAIGAVQNGGGALFASIGAAYMGVTATQTNQTYTWGSSLTVTASGAAIFDALTADTGGTTIAPVPTWESISERKATTTNTISVNVAGVSVNDVVVILSYCEQSGGGPAISSISGGGLTWTQRSRSHGSGRGSLEVWYAQITGTLAVTAITVNYAATFDNASVVAFSVAGCNSAIWDSSLGKSQSNVAGGNWTPSVAAVSTTQAHDMMLAIVGTNNASGNITSVPPGFVFLDFVQSTGGTYQPYFAFGTQARNTTQSASTVAWSAFLADQAGSTNAGGEYIVDALTADAAAVGGTTQARAMILA